MTKITEVLLDCDGILSNFPEAACKAHGREYVLEEITSFNWYQDIWEMSSKEFWQQIRGHDFWYNMEPYPWAKELIELLDYEFTIVTSPSLDSAFATARTDWLYHHFKIRIPDIMIGSKKFLMANPAHLLIDDRDENIDSFTKRGGRAVTFPQPWNRGREYSNMRMQRLKDLLTMAGVVE